jgi:hypothetical protein
MMPETNVNLKNFNNYFYFKFKCFNFF